jgi:Ca2+-binding EF-hand superfamily protein
VDAVPHTDIHWSDYVSKKENLMFVIVVLMFALVAAAAGQRASTPKPQDKEALGEGEVKQLLLLMDTDKNGKISKQEYMSFMEAEFDRLDKDKSGELDPKELTQSQFRVSHPFPSVGK